MKFLAIFLGVIFGIVLFLGLIALIFYSKFKRYLRKLGFHVHSMNDMADEMARIKREDSTRVRSTSGMTSLLLPNIREDFPDFNEKELYTKAESAMRQSFSAIENKNLKEVYSLPLLRDSIQKIIEDYESADIHVKYDDINFHKFSIYHYEKKNGMATVTISVAVEYYYKKTKGDKVLKDFSKYKHQTRYHCSFVYIYDESKVGDAKVLAINCPNCGAPIRVLGHKYCDYCGSAVQEVNLKSWECSSYEEY